MSKELVISSNRHETKVAILEDDQLVEVFFQRANEYSLAGSIHKGRVTRVLPGMQSAFVDLGLERDTFLYVSDFFDENEEYDALPEDRGGRRDRGERGERGERPDARERGERIEGRERGERPDARERGERTDARERSDRPDARERGDRIDTRGRGERPEGRERGDSRERGERERPEREAPPSAMPLSITSGSETIPGMVGERPPAQAGPASPNERTDDDRGDRRGGRRGRRRRGRGRGFPEAKYASPGAEPTEESAAEPAAVSDDDFMVLPGESLAKYRRDEDAAEDHDSVEAHEEADADVNEFPAAETKVDEALDDDLSTHILEQVEAEEERRSSLAEAPEEVAEAGEPANEAAEADEPVEPEEAVDEDDEDEDEIAQAAELLREAIHEKALAASADPDEEIAAAAADEEVVVAEGEPDVDIDGEADAEADADEAAVVEPLEDEAPVEAAETDLEAPEPARMPQSLTATLREQGGRYPHRGSGGGGGGRRMRRRGRGGFPAPAAPGAELTAPAPRAELRTEAGAPPAKTAPRPERGDRSAQPSITELLKEGQEILVQIAKEPLGQKGARITSHIALPGRYVVYMPTVEHLGVSRKIGSDEERLRLKRILQTHRAGMPGGFIMRTAGEGKSEQDLANDMQYLFNLWLDIRQKAEARPAPALIYHDLEIVQRILRDQASDEFKSVWTDSEEIYESVLRFAQRFQPNLVGRIKLYTRSAPIFDAFNVTAELEKALRPKVWLKSGGYIVINQTEALVAIDVNTGKFVGKSNRLEDTIVKTNTEAVKEIVRQIRLRDLGGIIVVDFIDMDERKNRQKVMQALEEAMRADRAPYKILQFNDFGLVAITRKRVKQSLERTLCSPCPYCEGAGYVKSVQTVVGEILQEAQKIVRAVEDQKDCMLRVHPEVAKLLKSTGNQYLEELEGILGRPVIVIGDPALHQEKYDLA
ncbi:MAG: Rne/Rng family ribonuclease [Bryobacteraceae bacterium]|nr:Rne/Rng family ribonuclease [Bryobacteraceae bacterium]